jgi:hypothetical protein
MLRSIGGTPNYGTRQDKCHKYYYYIVEVSYKNK